METREGIVTNGFERAKYDAVWTLFILLERLNIRSGNYKLMSGGIYDLINRMGRLDE
jgi:hypothetical protein